jgi:Na+-transporting methylmalonyl-CoA/oxaloacetate decarboxylase gamma subunit
MFRLNMILLALLIAAIAAIGILVGRSFGGGGPGIISDKKETDIRATVREVLPAAEFISLHYRYTSVINNVDSKTMFGVSIPGT